MKKNNIASIICGLVIIITTIIMIFRLGFVANEQCLHASEWTLGVSDAVQMTTSIYGIIIIGFTIALVIINVLKK